MVPVALLFIPGAKVVGPADIRIGQHVDVDMPGSQFAQTRETEGLHLGPVEGTRLWIGIVDLFGVMWLQRRRLGDGEDGR